MSMIQSWLQSLDYSFEILPNCTKAISPLSTCNICVSVCTDDAIQLKNNIPVIDTNKCTECTKCLVECPVQAIAGILPARKVKEDKLFLNDSHVPTVKELLIYYKKNVKTIVLTEEKEEFITIIHLANEYLREMSLEPFTLLDSYVEEEEKYSRADLFQLFKKESKQLIKEVTPAKWRFNHEHVKMNNLFKEYEFYSISLNQDKCILCNACEKLCPDKCFTITDNAFIISAQACQGCNLCVDVCREDALQITKQIRITEEKSIPIIKTRCNSCRKHFLSMDQTTTTCYVCTKKQQYSGYLI